MGRRKLTQAEIEAYRDMAAAARRLEAAQRAAQEQTATMQCAPISLSLNDHQADQGGGEHDD